MQIMPDGFKLGLVCSALGIFFLDSLTVHDDLHNSVGKAGGHTMMTVHPELEPRPPSPFSCKSHRLHPPHPVRPLARPFMRPRGMAAI